MATGLLSFASKIFPIFTPSYGWVDEWGWNLPEGKALRAKFPQYLFWANFFGPEMVHAIGETVIREAPGWCVVDLEDGGLLYVATESYRQWWENDQTEILAHFRTWMPRIRIYRAQPIPC